MVGVGELRVFRIETLGSRAGFFQCAQIAQFGRLQRRKAALSRSEEIARPTHLEIKLCEGETVIVGLQRLKASGAIVGVGARRGVREQDAIGLVCSAPYTTSELVQLRQAESFGALDDDDGGIGHIYPNFHNACCDQDVERACAEGAHDGILLFAR